MSLVENARESVRRDPEFWVIGAFVVALVLFLIWAIPASMKEQAAWETWCTNQGGHVDKSTKTSVGTGVNPQNGQPVTTTSTSTTYFCLSEDGRVLDIK